MQSPANSRVNSPMPSNQQFLLTKHNPQFVDQSWEKEQEQTVHFWDWVTFEKGSDYILGHYQGTNGLSLEVISKTNCSKRYLSFGFFVILPLSEDCPKFSPLQYPDSFYLMHVQTGLYLASLLNQLNQQTVFDHMTLKAHKDESCLFKFKKEMKGSKNIQEPHRPSLGSQDYNTAESSHECVFLNSSLRIFNCLTSKYIELVKIDTLHHLRKPSSPIKYTQSKQLYSSNPPQDALSKRHQTFQKPDQHCSNIWLSDNFDYFTIRLQRRSKEYNPVLLSNYDTVMVYNQFTNCYIGVKKKRSLIEVSNLVGKQKDEIFNQSIKKISQNLMDDSQKFNHDNKNNPLSSSKIQVNQFYLSTKNCLVEETPVNAFQNKQTLSYLWKVFTRPYHKTTSLVDRYHDTLSHPSLIKSKEVLYFQHVETGLFMLKNEEESENGQTYVLCEDFDDLEEEKDESGRFMFRVQNLCVLRYEKEFVMNKHWSGRTLPLMKNELTAQFQPINISLPVTIDFEEQQFTLSKLPVYPRINYFTFHFSSFLNLMISFLNNPKAIDDRIYLLRQKLVIIEMIYEKILCEGFVEIVSQIDKGFYFLDSTVKIVKAIRVKMRQYELEAISIKNLRENVHESSNKKKTHTNITQQKSQSKKHSNAQNQTHDQNHYFFQNLFHPFEELLELNNTIFTVLKPLIKKILNFLALVFGSRNPDIFHIINQTTQLQMFNAYQAENMTRSAQKNFQDNSSAQIFDTKSIIIKKNLTKSRISKSRIRNSSSSFKSNNSSSSNFMQNSIKNQKSSKSPLSAHYYWNDKESCTSELLKELIKSLVHLLQVEPKASTQILKLIGTQQPYEIISQINQKLQKLEERLVELTGSAQHSNKYFGYETASHVVIGTTLRLQKQFQTAIHEEMYHCFKLINHIIEYFNDDLEYDWSKKLKHIESCFKVKTNYSKESKEEHLRDGPKKDSQIAIEYKNRWYKMSEVLRNTQRSNFRKIYKVAKEKLKKQSSLTKKQYKHTIKSQNNQKPHTKNSLNLNQKSRGSLFSQRQNLQRKNSDHISSLSEGTIFNANFPSFLSTKKISENKKLISGKQMSRKEFVLVEEEKNFFYQCLKQVMKLKVINLKSRSLPLMEILPSTGTHNLNHSIRNYFSMYKQLPSLAFVLQIANNIEISLLNNLSSSSESFVNISLLNNSRYICCDLNPINENTNLLKVLNFKPFGSEEDTQFLGCPVYFKEDTVDYLIHQSPFSYESLQIIFGFLAESKSNNDRSEQLQLEISSESMQGLKVFLISLEIFVSVGKFSFSMLKKIEKYLLKICSLVVKYEENKLQIKKQSSSTEKPTNNFDGINPGYPNQNPLLSPFGLLPAEQITSGIKDTIESMMIELNEIMETLFIQKKRLINYPYISDPTQFFEGKYFKCQYGHLIKSSSSISKDMPILTEMFELSNHLAQSVSVLGDISSVTKATQKSYFPPYQEQSLHTLTHTKMSSVLAAYQSNEALLTWPYLSPEQILIFYPKQLTLYQTTFTKTSSTIISLNELTLLLKTLKTLQNEEKIKNTLVIEVKEKIISIAINLRSLLKLEGNRKIIKSFGLIEMVLGIVLSNRLLQKSAIKPFLEFLIEIRMWNVTLRQALRVLAKGGLSTQFIGLHKSLQFQSTNSNSFLINNIKKQQFFVIMAKYLQQKSFQEEKFLITELISSNLIEILDYFEAEPYQSFMEKISFVSMLIEVNPSAEASRKLINKLLNRQDVQLYIEALKTIKNFEYFCQNVKNMKILLQSKRLIQETMYNHNTGSENVSENRGAKNSSIFNASSIMTSHPKIKKMSNEPGGEREEMTKQKRQQISRFVLMMTTIFRICKSDPQLVEQYMGLFLSFKEFLKILRCNIASLGFSYELLKPLLVYLESNLPVLSQDQSCSRPRLGSSSGGIGGGLWYQNEILCHLQPLNDILSQHYLHVDEIESYLSTSTFFLPFIEDDDSAFQEQMLEFSNDKVKKINSEIKNFSKKNYFWQLLLWVPSYQKEEGLLVLIEKILLKNLSLFATKTPMKTKKTLKSTLSDSLEKLQIPLNRVLHSIYDHLLNIDAFLQNCQTSRFSRLQTRMKKLKQIFIEIFPTIESSLAYLKSQKFKLIKQKQELADSHIIEEEDEDSFGFFSDQKNPKSQHSYFDRLDSFESINRKDKSKRFTKKIVLHEGTTTQVKRTLLNKERQREERQKAEMIGYQFVTKLINHQKLEKFIKVFQQNENHRKTFIMEETPRQRAFKEEVESIRVIENDLINNFEQYLDDESEDCVVDMRESSKVNKSQKEKGRGSNSMNRIQGSQNKFELREKKSRSQINELQSVGDSSNYSHHAIIVAENSLQEDLLNNKNEMSSSKVTSQANNPNRQKRFLTRVAFEPTFSLKDFKRTDYSNFYEKLKSYKYYEVMELIRRVVYDQSSRFEVDFQCQQQNELFYELERFLLDFYRCNGTVNQLFLHIQTYLKLEAQRTINTEYDYRPGCEVGNVSNKFSFSFRKCINDQAEDFLNQMCEICCDRDLQLLAQKEFNPEILFVLYNREKYDIVDNLLKDYLTGITEKEPSFNKLIHAQGQIKLIVEFLTFCLEKGSVEQNTTMKMALIKEESGNRMERSAFKEKNIFQSQNISFTSPNLSSGNRFHSNAKSSVTNLADVSHQHTSEPNYNQQLTECLRRKLFRLKIVSRLIVIINYEYAHQVSSNQSLSLIDRVKVSQVQQNLNCYVYDLIESLVPVLQNREAMKYRPTIDSVQVMGYQIKQNLTQHLLHYVSFINLSSSENFNDGFSPSNSPSKLKHKPNISNMINLMLSFCLGESYEQLIRSKNFLSQKKSLPNKTQIKLYKKPQQSCLEIGSICLLKEFLNTMGGYLKDQQNVRSSEFLHSTLVFSQELVVGSLDYSMKLDLTSSNVQSLEIISLLTSSLAFLQILLSSISSIKMFHNIQLREYFFRFYLPESDSSQKWSEIDFNAQMIGKMIEFEIYLYEILFKNKFGKFQPFSHLFYLKHMMESFECQMDSQEDFAEWDLEEEKAKPEQYAVLMHLLMDSLNFIHQIYFKINSFPQFETDLYEQRKLIIEQDTRLKIRIDEIKQIYYHLQSILGIVVVSPQRKSGINQLEVATFPTFKEFEFVWKFSLIKLCQSFIDESIRRKLVYGTTMVFMEQSNKFRKVKYYVTKMGQVVCRVCEVLTLTMIMCQLFLPFSGWRQIVIEALMAINVCLLLVIMIEKLFPTVIITEISGYLSEMRFTKYFFSILFIYLPILMAIVANIWGFWQKKAILGVLLVFLFNRFQLVYAFLQRHYKSIKTIFLYLARTIVLLLTFHLIIQLNIENTLLNEANYLSSDVPLYVINDEPFNFLGMLFEKVKDQYMADPLIIFYYLFNLLNYILIVAASVFYMIEGLKQENINVESGKIRECYVCSKKAQLLLEEEVQVRDKKEKEPMRVIKEKNHHIKEHYFNNNDRVRKLYDKSVNFIPQREREQLMGNILQFHINQRHNLFKYISYFCYLLDKKHDYLSEKEKMIRERFESKDFQVYA